VGLNINKFDREQLSRNELLHHPEDISLCLRRRKGFREAIAVQYDTIIIAIFGQDGKRSKYSRGRRMEDKLREDGTKYFTPVTACRW
jgi:hypothetical protein